MNSRISAATRPGTSVKIPFFNPSITTSFELLSLFAMNPATSAPLPLASSRVMTNVGVTISSLGIVALFFLAIRNRFQRTSGG